METTTVTLAVRGETSPGITVNYGQKEIRKMGIIVYLDFEVAVL